MAKKAVPKDWHRADIKAAVHKAGYTMTQLARNAGYASDNQLHDALRRPWPKAERIIAEAIGQRPQAIWPSRYHADGTPLSGRGERSLGRYKKHSKPTQDGVVQVTDGV
jgi:Ner family transcriptional regulator